MFAKCLAVLMLVLLALVPAAGSAQAFGTDHCVPVMQGMAMDHPAPVLGTGCHHQEPHRQAPCSMAGLCAMAGCMAFENQASAEALPVARDVSFRITSVLPLEGLAPAPLLEPPRA